MKALSLLTSFLAASAAFAGSASGSLVERAESGDEKAIHSLCYSSLYGNESTKPDYEQAAKWCQAGTDAGISGSIVLFAEMHHMGLGMPKAPQEAVRLYKLAAETGHIHAQFMLGFIHLTSEEPTEEDVVGACYWLSKSAEQGYPKAQEVLNALNEEGKGTGKTSFCDRVLSESASDS